jgi:hypothetical protein
VDRGEEEQENSGNADGHHSSPFYQSFCHPECFLKIRLSLTEAHFSMCSNSPTLIRENCGKLIFCCR